MKLNVACLTLCCAFLAEIGSANATPIDYGYPPPGLVTYSSNGGIAGNPGGVVNSYSNFDATQYGQLYYGVNWVDMGTANGTSDLTNIGPFGGSTETWSGQFSIQTLYGPVYATGVFTATLSTGSWIDPTSVGINGSGAPLAVTNVTGDFSVTETFTVNGTPFNNWYNSFNTLNIASRTDFGGDFWATPVVSSVNATPLPAALPLFASGLGGIGLVRWRRKKRQLAKPI